MIKWLMLLYACLFVLIVSHFTQLTIAHTLNNANEFYSLDVLQWFSGVGLVGLLISPFLFPSILYGLPRVQKANLENMKAFANKNEILPKLPPEEEDVFANSMPEYESDYLVRIELIIDDCMKEMQPYLHSECNMAYFAKMIKVPAHHLAYYFKEVKQQSFNDYRNAWRVKHAKELIRQRKTEEYTFEAIGMLSGFSSKNTFFTTFKKIEGITPGAYNEQINS